MAYLTHILEQEDGVLFRGFVIRNTKGEVLASGAGNISLQHQLFIFFRERALARISLRRSLEHYKPQKQTVRYRELEQHTNEKTEKAHEVVDYIG